MPEAQAGAPSAGRALHDRYPVLDAHVDTVLALEDGRCLNVWGEKGHADLPRLLAGGVRYQVFALFIQPQFKPERALGRVLHLWDTLARALSQVGGQARLCTAPEDLAPDAVPAGRLGVIVSIEGGEAVGTDLALVRVLHRLGVRAMGLTWNERNAIADGAGEAEAGGGLTRFGRALVAEMNRVGMIVDVSHLCPRSFWDVLAVSRRPVIASHSNARALCDHVRNLDDAQIRALAAAGGVMGMNFFADFLDQEPDRADIARVCDHIDHICDLVGPEHVGLGSDFDGIVRPPTGLEDVSRLPALTEALLRRGYNEGDLTRILGGNFLRVFRAGWIPEEA
jgi:membrane dipeptidase